MNPNDTTAIAHKDEETPTSSDLHFESNPICFIDRLPVDTLESIFVECACDYFREDIGLPIPTAPSWVNVSYVSRHWRDVALNFPTLWTYIFITSPRWTTELLARSKQASLKVVVNYDYDLQHWGERHRWGFRFVEQVMDHVERIQECHLRLSVYGYEVLSKMSSPAPRLRHLEISTDFYPSNWSSLLFDGDTPALRTLHFNNCPVPWYSLKLTGLTKLSLRQIPAQFQQNTAEFLAMLGCMQDLKYLYLGDAFASAAGFLSSPVFRSFQKINLPQLSQLLLFAPLSMVIAFFSCIDIPLETEVYLGPAWGVEHSSSFFDDFAPLCSVLAQRYSVLQAQAPFHSLIIIYAGILWAQLNFSVSERDCNVPLRITFPLEILATRNNWDRLIICFCSSMPLSHVQTLHVIDPPFSESFWTDLLGRLQGLRYLKLSNGDMPNLASALSLTSHIFTENRNAHADRGQSQILAPALEELRLHGISFLTTLERDMDPLQGTDLQCLCNALSTRKEPRGRLTMTGCFQHISGGQPPRRFDLDGWWEDRRFHLVSYKDDSDLEDDSNGPDAP